jgi:hypothetical protein
VPSLARPPPLPPAPLSRPPAIPIVWPTCLPPAGHSIARRIWGRGWSAAHQNPRRRRLLRRSRCRRNRAWASGARARGWVWTVPSPATASSSAPTYVFSSLSVERIGRPRRPVRLLPHVHQMATLVCTPSLWIL